MTGPANDDLVARLRSPIRSVRLRALAEYRVLHPDWKPPKSRKRWLIWLGLAVLVGFSILLAMSSYGHHGPKTKCTQYASVPVPHCTQYTTVQDVP